MQLTLLNAGGPLQLYFFFVYFCCCCLFFTSLALLAFDHHLLCVPLWMLINMVNPVIILYNLINQIVDFPQWIPDCDTVVLLFWIYIKGLLEYMFCSYLPFINFPLNLKGNPIVIVKSTVFH